MNRQEAIKTLMAAGKSREVAEFLNMEGNAANPGYNAIAADDSLSDKGKLHQLAVAYVQRLRRIDQSLESMANRVVRTDRDDAERVFGTKGLDGDAASLTISRRDAADRVAQVQSRSELRDLLRRATRSGDEVLARAVVERAVEELDADAVNQFTADRPELESAAERLWDAQRAESDTFGMTMQLANLRPAELMGMSSDSIEQLAITGPEPAVAR